MGKIYNYEDIINEAEMVQFNNYLGEFFIGRINRLTLPLGKYVYYIRHDDDSEGKPVSIEDRHIYVNFFGSFVTTEEIKFDEGVRYIDIYDVNWNPLYYKLDGDKLKKLIEKTYSYSNNGETDFYIPDESNSSLNDKMKT